MAEKVATAGRAPEVDGPEQIRNVVLVGHTGAGKTTIVEMLLAHTGAIGRAGRVEDGTTTSDHDEVEHRTHRSVNLTLAPVRHAGIKINLLDTPGYADFVGDLRAGLRAADAALFVVSAVDGVDGTTVMLWEECATVGMPRAIVVTHLDSVRADFDSLLAILQRVFGESVQPLYLPVAGDDDHLFVGEVGLLTQNLYDYSSGNLQIRPAEQEHRDLIELTRSGLLEGIIAESEDESLMDRYLAGDQIDAQTLLTDLEKAVARGSFYPVYLACPALGIGAIELLEGLVGAFPSPLEHPLPPVTTPDGAPKEPMTADPAGPLVAEVIKTTSDPYVGRISLVRVFSGTLRPDIAVHVSGHGLAARGHADHDLDERVGAMSSPLGRLQRPIEHAIAGDIVAVAKLAHAETSDTLSDPADPALMESWLMPEPLLPVAITAHSKTDDDKLSQALSRLVAEDPTMRLDMDGSTHQVVLWAMGEAHVDLLLDRLRNRYGVAVDSEALRVSLRETFASPGQARGRHVKQSGGHGQFAICDIVVEPLPTGAGFEFIDEIVGGAVPRQFIPSVEKGVRAQLERGVVAGYPVVDIRVRLVDGKAHPVDSSDSAFQMAGGLALREAAQNAQISLLEPVDELNIVVADEYVGGVMSDLSGRRGRVLGSEPISSGRTIIHAEAPATELTRYPVDLRSLSQGTGNFTRSYARHEPMPQHLATKVFSSAEAEKTNAKAAH